MKGWRLGPARYGFGLALRFHLCRFVSFTIFSFRSLIKRP